MTAPTADRPLILPPLRRTVADAREFAWTVHKSQKDKAGLPYIGHLERVQDRLLPMLDEAYDVFDGRHHTQRSEARQIAWLHDVIEDTPYTTDDLRAEGFSEYVVDGVVALTKLCATPYLAWINHLAATDPLSVLLVKIADIEDNSDPERLALLDEPTRERLKAKYGAARMGWRQGHG